MVQVSYPGVYIQEVPSGARTITGVSTAVAAFVGMAKRGPIKKPTTVLGFTDYTRIFSDDTSQGEMTDQVRQFFLNGGRQAVIVRIASGEMEAAATLPGTPALTLTARSAGGDGNFLRASVDYNTASPESTFNLTVFREVFDAAGGSSVGEQEVLRNLSVDENHPRYVVRVLEQESVLVTGTLASVPVAAESSSIAAVLAAADGIGLVVGNAVRAAAPVGATASFMLRVGSATGVVNLVVPASGAVAETDFLLPPDLSATGVTITYQNVSTSTQILRISHASEAVSVTPGPANDISVALGLGVAQGGLEFGPFAAARPTANGLFTSVGSAGDDALALIEFSESDKDDFNTSALTVGGGVGAFTIPSGRFTFPAETIAEGTAADGFSLLNVRETLNAIADVINAAPENGGFWRAEVHGYRLVLVPLVPEFVNFTQGAAHNFTSPASLAALSAGASQARSTPFINGLDGGKPGPTDYQAAYDIIDSEVDLFNILVLPKSRDDTMDDRADFWGAASSFCLRRRAFLLIDAGTQIDTVPEALEAVQDLRLGIVKDHSALYWPRVEVNPDGNRRFIDPSGTIAGIMSRIDSNRGVWKAPAGLEADLRGVLGVRVPMSDPENGLLNPQALNAIRVFPSGIVSWGARTMDGFDNSGNDDYKYVPVRRFTLFLEESLFRGLKFAVFEPNDEPLWAQIRLAVGAFMNNLFRQGAFAGRTTREAYFVKVDSETTTQNDINLGIVNVVVGFAPLKPAEFVVVTIKQQAGQIQV